MKRCKVCGTTYQDKSEFCLKCNLPLAKSTTSKPDTPKHEKPASQNLEKKIKNDYIQDISKEIVKVSVQHPLTDNTGIKNFFDPKNTKDFKDSIGFSSTELETTIGEITLTFQTFILSNVRIVESTRNTALKGSLFYIIAHFFDQINLDVVKKQLIGIDKFVEEYNSNSNLLYPIAIVGLQNSKSGENLIDQEKKKNFQIDLEIIVSKISGLKERFIIKYFDFSNSNILDFKELGSFYFERFLKEQKVPKFELN